MATFEFVKNVKIKVDGELVEEYPSNSKILETIREIAKDEGIARATVKSNIGELSPNEISKEDTFEDKGITEIDIIPEYQGA